MSPDDQRRNAVMDLLDRALRDVNLDADEVD